MVMKSKLILIIILIFSVPFLQAKGAVEKDREYDALREDLFIQVLESVEAGEIPPAEGKGLLSELRSRYGKSFSDEEGILESLIDQVGEGRISAEEAFRQYNLMRSGELMAYRKDAAEKAFSGNGPVESAGDQGNQGNQGGKSRNNGR